MPEEQAFCLFVKTLTDYGHRELFMDSFDKLHQRFYTLERLMEVMARLILFIRARFIRNLHANEEKFKYC